MEQGFFFILQGFSVLAGCFPMASRRPCAGAG